MSSNMGKVFERIINNRVTKMTHISDAQAGGKEGRSTVDHLLILKEVIRMKKVKKQPYA